jgi:hypothetical protein
MFSYGKRKQPNTRFRLRPTWATGEARPLVDLQNSRVHHGGNEVAGEPTCNASANASTVSSLSNANLRP